MIKKTDTGAEISKSTVVRGRVHGAEALSVSGRIEGTVALDAKLTVEKSGLVKADVEADEVIVRGVLIGNVRARRAVRLEAGARVVGDLEAPAIAIAEGAQFSGAITTGEPVEVAPADAVVRYEPERVAKAEVIMRPVVDTKRRVVVKKRT